MLAGSEFDRCADDGGWSCTTMLCHSACKILVSCRGRKLAEESVVKYLSFNRTSPFFFHLQMSAVILCVATQLTFKMHGKRISLT